MLPLILSMERLAVKVLWKIISLIYIRVYLETIVHKNPTCFSRWSFRREDKHIIAEAIGRYCKKHDINTDHIYNFNLLGELVPRKIREGRMNIDEIVNSRDNTLIEWEVKDNIKEIRNELAKRKMETEYDIKWIGNKKERI